MVGEASAHVQGESLKALAALLTEACQLPDRQGAAMSIRIVRCRSCGTANRVRLRDFARVPHCGQCGVTLPEPTNVIIRRLTDRWWPSALVLVAFAGLIAWPGASEMWSSLTVEKLGNGEPSRGIENALNPTPAIPEPTRMQTASAVSIVSTPPGGPAFYSIAINGEIDQTVAKAFEGALTDPRIASELVAPPEFARPFVSLNSPGGDVDAAMAIGRELRAKDLSTVVSKSDQCNSACVLVLAGGVRRSAVAGRIGIHRPHFDEMPFAALSAADARSAYERMSDAVRKYLSDMGIADQLYLDMLKVSSDDARFLTEDEMTAYGLVGEDPAWAEYRRAYQVSSVGFAQYEENQAFTATVLDCYNDSRLSTTACDTDVTRRWERAMTECVSASSSRSNCVNAVRGQLHAFYLHMRN